ncbi:MAG: MFS transporter [Chloroflexi bacterium]|nr:MAG: MFS transporter [Chloroflexota bacterium]
MDGGVGQRVGPVDGDREPDLGRARRPLRPQADADPLHARRGDHRGADLLRAEPRRAGGPALPAGGDERHRGGGHSAGCGGDAPLAGGLVAGPGQLGRRAGRGVRAGDRRPRRLVVRSAAGFPGRGRAAAAVADPGPGRRAREPDDPQARAASRDAGVGQRAARAAAHAGGVDRGTGPGQRLQLGDAAAGRAAAAGDAAGLAAVAIFLIGISPWAALVVVAIGLNGLFSGVVIPATASMIGLETPRDAQSTVFGFNASSIALGFFFGPLIGGTVAATSGVPAALFVIAALSLVLATLLATGAREPPR